MTEYKNHIVQMISELTGLKSENVTPIIEYPPSDDMGDFAFPCFTLAKEWRQAPAQIASTLAAQIAVREPIASAVAQGPYLNFTLDYGLISRDVLRDIAAVEALLVD